jgi:hypothetical protein
MMKLSKSAKARIKRMSASEKKKLRASARFLADEDCISNARYLAIMRACNSGYAS